MLADSREDGRKAPMQITDWAPSRIARDSMLGGSGAGRDVGLRRHDVMKARNLRQRRGIASALRRIISQPWIERLKFGK